MNYRDELYKNYSDHFGKAKPYAPEVEEPVFENVYRNISTIGCDAKIADLGCGRGEWLTWLKNKGYEHLTGFDIAASELEKADSFDGKLNLVNGDITETLKEFDQHYDVLHSKDVLEHLTKDEAVKFFKSSFGALKKGGELWILTYNAQAPLASATGAGDFTHELAVTPTSLAQLGRACGFEVKSVRGVIPVRGGLKGLLRTLLYQISTASAFLVRHLRHGIVRDADGVERATLLPDLYAVFRRAE